jgi:hypothetical protein
MLWDINMYHFLYILSKDSLTEFDSYTWYKGNYFFENYAKCTILYVTIVQIRFLQYVSSYRIFLKLQKITLCTNKTYNIFMQIIMFLLSAFFFVNERVQKHCFKILYSFPSKTNCEIHTLTENGCDIYFLNRFWNM